MTKASPLLLISFVLFGASNLQSEPQCPGKVATVRYHSLGQSQIAIPVTINGSGPYEFMVDTGSDFTMIDPALASELRLEPQGSMKMTAVSSQLQAQLLLADTVAAASHTVARLLLAVSSLMQIQAANPRMRGLLGENFLSHFDLLIDYRQKVLCLDDSARMRETLRGERIPLEAQARWRSDLPFPQPYLISAQLGGSSKIVLRIDSGAALPLLYKDYAEKDDTDTQDWMRPVVHSPITGKQVQSFKLLRPSELKIGKAFLRGIEFLTPTGSTTAKPGQDGLLPTSLFHRVFLSYTEHYAIFNPDWP